MTHDIILSAIQEPFVFELENYHLAYMLSTVDVVLYHGETAILSRTNASFTKPDMDKIIISVPGVKAAIEDYFEDESVIRESFKFEVARHYDDKDRTSTYEINVYRENIVSLGAKFLHELSDPYTTSFPFQPTTDGIQSVSLRIEQGNGIVAEISTVDYSVNGNTLTTSFFGLRSVIHAYMKEHLLNIADFTLIFSVDDGGGIATYEEQFSVLFSRFRTQGLTADELLNQHFLNSANFIIAPVDEQLTAYHYFPAGRTTIKIRVYAQVENGIDYNEWSLHFQNIEPGIYPITITPSEYIQIGYENYLYWEIIAPNSANVLTIYPLRDKYNHHIQFLNRFGLVEDVFIPCQHATEQEKEYESGVINDKLVPYDIERIITHTLSADAVSPQLIPYLREIAISEDVAIDGEPIIVTEYDIPSSDELNASTAFSLSYQPQTKNGIDKL